MPPITNAISSLSATPYVEQISMIMDDGMRIIIVVTMTAFAILNAYYAKSDKLNKFYFNSWFCMFAALITALTL